MTAKILNFLEWGEKRKLERERERKLKRLLADPQFKIGRSLEELRLKTGMKEQECRTLLSKVGAHGITLQDGRDGWQMQETKGTLITRGSA